MTVDEARVRLQAAGFVITEEKRLGNGTGTQLKVKGPGFNEVSVNIYDKGTHHVQGSKKEQVENALSQPQVGSSVASAPPLTSPAPSVSAVTTATPATSDQERERIFVVHGHDKEARVELQLALHELGLDPFVLANTSGGGLTIIEALEKEIGPDANRIRFGIVLLTPDDIGYSKIDGPEKSSPRARQNVVLEMGMLISAIGRQNVAILKRGNLEVPSDANGILYIPFHSNVKETISTLCDRLIQAGFQLETNKVLRATKFA